MKKNCFPVAAIKKNLAREPDSKLRELLIRICLTYSIFSPCFKGYTLEKYTQKSSEDINIIRQADLENHNKDGGLWVVIHGKVYDVQEFKAQAPCGTERLLSFAGNDNEHDIDWL